MIVKFYTLPFQFESRIRPDSPAALEAVAGSPVTADINIPNTFDKVATFDRDLSIEFSDYNYAVIAGYGFWFFAHTHKANREPVITCTFTRDPWYEYGKSKVKGIFNALPTYEEPYLPFTVANANTASKADYTGRTRLKTFPNFVYKGRDYGVLWVEFKILDNSGSFHKYGAFVGSSVNDPYGNRDENPVLCRVSSSERPYGGLTISAIINNLNGIMSAISSSYSASMVVDIAVSDIVPYDCRIISYDAEGRPIITLVNPSSGHDLYATRYGNFAVWPMTWTGPENAPRIHDITSSDLSKWIDSVRNEIHDGNGNLIGIIPKITKNGSVRLKSLTVSDITGITTTIMIDGWDSEFIIPHGHLPYSGDAWKEYAKANLLYDRECMQINIDKANADAMTSAASSVAGGALVGAIGGNPAGIATGLASSGIGLATSLYSNQIAAEASRKEQSAKEQMYRLSNSTPYNTGYGISYCVSSARIGTHIEHVSVMMNEDLKPSYIKKHGYPAVGERNLTLGTGYYSGYIEMFLNDQSAPVAIPKLLHDIMNNELAHGVQFVERLSDI